MTLLAAAALGGLAAGATPWAVDGPLKPSAACATPAPQPVQQALEAGVPLRGRPARLLLADARPERALVRRVMLRARRAWVCDGRLVVADLEARLVGPGGAPVEAALATRIPAGPVLAVTRDDVAVTPPAHAWRITRRDTFVVYGVSDLGLFSGVGALPSGAPPSSRAE